MTTTDKESTMSTKRCSDCNGAGECDLCAAQGWRNGPSCGCIASGNEGSCLTCNGTGREYIVP